MDVKHWLLFAAGILLYASKGLAANLPAYAPYASTVESVLTALMAYFGATSGRVAWRGGAAGKAATALVVVGALGALQQGCLPASFPSDVLKIYECVQTEIEGGVTNVGQIVLACKAPEEQVVIDAINGLLDSPKWVADHPQLVRGMVQMGGHQR